MGEKRLEKVGKVGKVYPVTSEDVAEIAGSEGVQLP